jgi:hypothetical protein
MMRDLADQTGGKYVAVPEPQKLESIFQEIGKSLQDECTFTYTSPDPVENGRKRNLTVFIRNGGVGTKAAGFYNVPGVLSTVGSSSGGRSAATSIGIPFAALAGVLALLLLVPQVIRFGPRITAEESAQAAVAARPVVAAAKPAKPQKQSSPMLPAAAPSRGANAGPNPKV